MMGVCEPGKVSVRTKKPSSKARTGSWFLYLEKKAIRSLRPRSGLSLAESTSSRRAENFCQ